MYGWLSFCTVVTLRREPVESGTAPTRNPDRDKTKPNRRKLLLPATFVDFWICPLVRHPRFVAHKNAHTFAPRKGAFGTGRSHMIPDLGKYASDVLMAYAVGIALLVGLIVLSLRQSAKARHLLQIAEDTVQR